MGYLWDLNFTLEYLFYSRISEKTPVKKNIHIAIHNLLLKRYTHISVTEYIKERSLFIKTIYFLITN